tara:strand:- start:143 stop:367 length:225 start_codon:yes stop_codon:yes gene_type:complete
MSIKNIISEGVLDRIIQFLGARALKKNKKLQGDLDDINKSLSSFEKELNKHLKTINPKSKGHKFKPLKPKDLFK